jgi:hypothetical protein
VQKSRRRRFENDDDSAFLAAVGFLKMTRLFEKANQLLAMSHGNVITGLTFPTTHPEFRGAFWWKLSDTFHQPATDLTKSQNCQKASHLLCGMPNAHKKENSNNAHCHPR